MKIDCVQLRHNNADSPESGELGQIYLPSSLGMAAARFRDAGLEVGMHDENIRRYEGDSEYVAVTTVGAPYVPEIIAFKERLAKNAKLIIGGQFINGLSDEEFDRLFSGALNGNKEEKLAKELSLKNGFLPPEETSLTSAYDEITDHDFKAYLEHEMAFYLSQGCGFDCTFCVAQKDKKERYRTEETAKKDLAYLVERAKKLGISELNFYLSNLDLFQTPRSLAKWNALLEEIHGSNPGFQVKWRALSTVTSFNHATRRAPELISSLKKNGLHTLGFGIDGAREEVWKEIKKRQSLMDCTKAMDACRGNGITPETLMVFGHPNETEQTLMEAVDLSRQFEKEYGAHARPHVAKIYYPGNPIWTSPAGQAQRELLLDRPEYFQALDFTAVPSSVSDPDANKRPAIYRAFRAICDLEGNETQWVHAHAPETDPNWEELRRQNYGRFDR